MSFYAYSCTQYSLHTQYTLLTHADVLLCLQLHTVQSPHTVHAPNPCWCLVVPTAAHSRVSVFFFLAILNLLSYQSRRKCRKSRYSKPLCEPLQSVYCPGISLPVQLFFPFKHLARHYGQTQGRLYHRQKLRTTWHCHCVAHLLIFINSKY